MKKIIYLFFALVLLALVSGCSIFRTTTKANTYITIGYVIDGKKEYRTYDSYNVIEFMDYETETGYEFVGWSEEVDGNVVTKVDLKGKSEVTLYPITKPINYRIIYDLDDGKNNIDNPTTYTIEDELTLKALSKEGFAFTGWTNDTITTPVLNYVIEKGTYGNISLKANYVLGKVNVIFYGYEELNQIIDYNTTCEKPENPIKVGDTFDYWATTDSLDIKFDFSTPITSNITLYPKWKSTVFHTLTINNESLINTNYPSGKKLPEGSIINLSTDYIIENKEFTGWYIDGDIYSKYYEISVKMPNSNMTITPMFNNITTYTYYIGSNTNLQTNITRQSDGKLFGQNVGNNYGHVSNKLFISYSLLDELKLGLNSFVYESRLIINVFIKIKEKDVTNVFVDYDTNYPYATLTFNEVEGYNYYYSLDGSEYTSCNSGEIFEITNKNTSHELDVKCENGTAVHYVIDAIPTVANTYLTNIFTYQGNTYDHYMDSDDDLKTILEYYIYSVYPSIGGTEYTFNFYNPFGGNLAEKYSKIIKGEISAPYGLQYMYPTSGNLITFKLLSSGVFNSLNTTQVRDDLTTTQFMPSSRSATFNDFFIEKYSTKTQEVKSIYELENLNVGVKPIISSTGKVRELYEKAKDILREYVDDSMNDFEKVKAIYDYLATFVTYDDALLEISTDYQSDYSSFTSYSALVRGIAVCDGISSAFKLLCTIEGIECDEVIGAATNGGHAWNKVKLGNVWYGVDATWSKRTINYVRYVYHTYFMINEAELLTIGNGHYEQAELDDYGHLIKHNIDVTANNGLSYYELMMYGDYDLVVSSLAEGAAMNIYFHNNNIKHFEIYLDGVSSSLVELEFTHYNAVSGVSPNTLHLISKTA